MANPTPDKELSKFEPDYTNPIFTQEQTDEMWAELEAYRDGERSATWIIEGVVTYFAKAYADEQEREALIADCIEERDLMIEVIKTTPTLKSAAKAALESIIEMKDKRIAELQKGEQE